MRPRYCCWLPLCVVYEAKNRYHPDEHEKRVTIAQTLEDAAKKNTVSFIPAVYSIKGSHGAYAADLKLQRCNEVLPTSSPTQHKSKKGAANSRTALHHIVENFWQNATTSVEKRRGPDEMEQLQRT